MISKVLTGITLFAIRIYRAAISSYDLPVCRFVPSCSEYAEEAIKRYGPFVGVYKSIKRLLRCHPFSSGGGYDPVS